MASVSSVCKNHPDLASLYFLSEHPHIRYCRNCALNVALCGRKIEKQLTAEEQQRKGIIDGISSELGNCIEEVKMNQGLFSKLQEYAEEVALPLQSRLGEIEDTIDELGEVKERLKRMFQEQIASKL